MHFIEVYHQSRTYKYKIEQLPTIKNRERWKVTAGNGELILQNNRPVFTRRGLKHRKPDWQAEGNGIWNRHFQELIVEAIERHIEGLK